MINVSLSNAVRTMTITNPLYPCITFEISNKHFTKITISNVTFCHDINCVFLLLLEQTNKIYRRVVHLRNTSSALSLNWCPWNFRKHHLHRAPWTRQCWTPQGPIAWCSKHQGDPIVVRTLDPCIRERGQVALRSSSLRALNGHSAKAWVLMWVFHPGAQTSLQQGTQLMVQSR